MAELRSQYDWLLFFSVPKLLAIYGLLTYTEPEEQLDQLMHEISFLFCNNQVTRDAVKANMEVCACHSPCMYGTMVELISQSMPTRNV